MKKKPNKNIEIKECRRTKEGGALKIPGQKKLFSDIRKFSVKIRRIKALKFYFDAIIHGFDVTYADFFEAEYTKEHIRLNAPHDRGPFIVRDLKPNMQPSLNYEGPRLTSDESICIGQLATLNTGETISTHWLEVAGVMSDRKIKAERKALANTIFLIPSDGDDPWVWCDDPGPMTYHDPKDAVKYVRADSLPQPSTEVPTVPGIYLMQDNTKYRLLEITLCDSGYYEGVLLYFINNKVPALYGENKFTEWLDSLEIVNPTFTLVRERT